MSKRTKKQQEVVVAVELTKATGSTMARHLDHFKPRYVQTVSARGNTTLCNGDDLAIRLSSKTPAEVLALASKLLGLDLKAKYASLNPGQQRMNAGNRLRSAIKKGSIKMDQVQ